jgi:hypothetical protein
LIIAVDSIKRNGELENIGGAFYVSSLLDVGTLGKNIRAYAELVRKAADNRPLICGNWKSRTRKMPFSLTGSNCRADTHRFFSAMEGR